MVKRRARPFLFRFKPGFCGGKEKERLLDLSFFYVAGPGIEPGTS